MSNSEKKSLFIETYLEVVDSLHQGEQGSHQQVGNLEQGGSLQEQGDIPHQEQEGSLHREQEGNQDQGDIHQLEDILDIPDKIWQRERNINPLHPNISMYNLYTVLYTFSRVLTRRIQLTIKTFFSWRSFPLFLWSCDSGMVL